MTQIYLVRHGQFNRLGNEPDPILTDRGLEEAEVTAAYLADIEIDEGVCNEVRRTGCVSRWGKIVGARDGPAKIGHANIQWTVAGTLLPQN